MKEKALRVGVLGYGLAGRYFHIPFIQALPQFELRAVATSRKEARSHLPDVRIVPRANDIIDADDIDLVVIATPHRLHVSQALDCVQAGKHVVVEKPVATTIAEIEALKQASSATNRHIIPFQNRRWDGDFKAVQALVASGMLGQIHHFETRWQMYRPQPRGVWRDTPDELGGILNDLAPHLIDHTLLLFGMPKQVLAHVMIHRPHCQVDDAFRIQMFYENGLYALLEMDVLNGLTVPRFALRGTNGTFERFGVDPQEALLRADISPSHAEWQARQPEKARIIHGGANGMTITGEMDIAPGDYGDYYALVAQAIHGQAEAPVTLDDVLRQMVILEAVRQSAKEGAFVQVVAS